MKLSQCQHCELPVLELEGQFTKLDPLYIRGDFPPEETAGWWHASCLAESDVGSAWSEARLRNFRDVRRYSTVAEYSHWIVLRDPNRGKLVAIGRHGEILNLSRGNRKSARSVDEGRIYTKVEETFNLEFDDVVQMRSMQEALLHNGRYPVTSVLQWIGIADRVVHPEVLERAAFVYDRALQRDWDEGFVAAQVEYGVFVPAELEPHVGELIR